MHRKPDGCTKVMHGKGDAPKIPASMKGKSEQNPGYSTPTAKMPKKSG
jgi:hypothetical protein